MIIPLLTIIGSETAAKQLAMYKKQRHRYYENYDHCMITGELVDEETMIFKLPEPYSCELVDYSRFEVVPREMFRINKDPELRHELRKWKKQRGNCDADS